MKKQDLGIDPKTGRHTASPLTHHESVFIGIMWAHVGTDNIIPANHLAVKFHYALADIDIDDADLGKLTGGFKWAGGGVLDECKRDVRRMHNHLIMAHDGLPILSRAGSGGGYWIADSDAEADRFYGTFRRRGMTGLTKAARGKRAAMVEIVQQLTFDFEEFVDRSRAPGDGYDTGGPSTPVAVVDAFLERMLDDPDKYAHALKMIGKKYGGVLLPATQVAAVREKAIELQRMIAGL